MAFPSYAWLDGQLPPRVWQVCLTPVEHIGGLIESSLESSSVSESEDSEAEATSSLSGLQNGGLLLQSPNEERRQVLPVFPPTGLGPVPPKRGRCPPRCPAPTASYWLPARAFLLAVHVALLVSLQRMPCCKAVQSRSRLFGGRWCKVVGRGSAR